MAKSRNVAPLLKSSDADISWEDWITMDIPPVDWLIPHVLAKGGAAILHGPPQSFKSFFLLRLCLDLSSGQRPLDIWDAGERPFRTLLLQGEGSKANWRDRMLALRDKYPAQLPFWSRHTVDLKLDTDKGIATMDAALKLVQPDLIVIDPVANFFIGDDVSQTDVGRWLHACNHWRESGPAVLLATHDRQSIRFAGKPGAPMQTLDAKMEEMRGSTRLPAWADFVASLRRTKGATARFTIQKIRDGNPDVDNTFNFEFIEAELDLRLLGSAGATGISKWILDFTRTARFQPEVVAACIEEWACAPMTPRRHIDTLLKEGSLQQIKIEGSKRFKIQNSEEAYFG